MRVVLLSDTHCQLSKVKVPDGDLLIHAGDLTYRGTVQEISQELTELSKLPHKHKVFICGNHDWLGERNPSLLKEIAKEKELIWLNHESIELEGLKIFGSAFTPEFCSWAFNVPRGEALKEKWSAIPDDTNVLITHGPPYGIQDACPDGRQVGCVDLLARLAQLNQLELSVFGHIHDSYGTSILKDKTFINASICNEQYKPVNEPIIINI